jgi:predicted TIM-barrel fold metal-dependent hydrolase
VVQTVGWDRVLFGSDFPHPEGLTEPRGYYRYAEGMDEKRTRDFMGDNARRLMGIPVRSPAGDVVPVPA